MIEETVGALASAWLLAKPYVTRVLIGASRWSQIEENLGALGNAGFSPDEHAAVDRACRE